MPYKTILFDIDGTLIDPKIGITSAIQYALSKFGIHEEKENLTQFIGPPIIEAFREHYQFSKKQANQARNYFKEYYIPKGIYQSTVYKGIPELLAKLHNAKHKLYVVTYKPTDQAETILAYHHLDIFFDGIKGPNPGLMNSTKTVLIRETMSLLPHERPHDIVMIGDREHDIIAAKENGIDSIGVIYGYGSLEEITIADPTSIAKSIAELEKYLL